VILSCLIGLAKLQKGAAINNKASNEGANKSRRTSPQVCSVPPKGKERKEGGKEKSKEQSHKAQMNNRGKKNGRKIHAKAG